MTIPADRKYTESHEWVRVEADGTVSVGITDFAQDALGDIVFVDLPKVGASLAAGKDCCVIESVKAAGDVYAPVAGEVVAVNDAVVDEPASINTGAFDAWLFKLKPANAADVDALLSAEAYQKNIG
ncbi:glycine cleavage system protein GcvH [Undibacterium sp. LX40W]|jgi:glycine cleavage system H protein|uniref:Glycine cleavage system H protein n=1 Tax=Undibacterium nitidum TaxID=2762298 RepID=A0A923HQU3_9BURK|nr:MULTISPECIES: glycine cleavage system protein GcvH [Undibacterium]MBC3882263.1 glycine cleavage system protein GcvH [Undibacterium nitidum]MBC3892544.1 glycine cleavage system protein GcvH [Undibacterium sp. LX40W]